MTRETISVAIINIWTQGEKLLTPVFKNFDPSLFQNIILGIMAIFIPFAIVFLTDLLGKNRQTRTEFEKMVWNEEVLGSRKVFWYSVVGLTILSFFSGTDVSVGRKVIAIVITVILVIIFGRSFNKILRFSEGYKPEFEINFFKKLKLKRILTSGNKLKKERMVRAWSSFWSEKSLNNERDFTKVFIDHIDNVIEKEQYYLVPLLGQTYQENLDKRDQFSIGYEILPKMLEWHEKLWSLGQRQLHRESVKERIQNSFSQEHFPTFKKWINQFLNRSYSKPGHFWNWHYFQQHFFPAISKILLQGGHEPYQLFAVFKKYIEDAEARLEKITDKDREQRWWNYIISLFGSFCSVFFEAIERAPNKNDIWHHYFPREWMITAENSKKRMPRVMLHEFLRWSQQRIFKKEGSVDHDVDLTEVVNGIFPNVHHSLFPAFLMMFVSGDLKYAVQNEPSFFLTNTSFSWSGEKSSEEIQEMFTQQDRSQKEETVKVIFEYFGHWSLLKIYKEDLAEEEFSAWNSFPKDKQDAIGDSVRKTKLQTALDKLNSKEMVDLCKVSELHEHQRKIFIELLQLLKANVG